MTLESWRIITHLDEDFNASGNEHGLGQVSDALALIDHTIMMLSAFSGLMEENMIRGPEWHFLDLGRRLERAAHTTGLLRNTLVDADDREGSVLEALLEIGDSSITYRSRYLTALQCVPVLDRCSPTTPTRAPWSTSWCGLPTTSNACRAIATCRR